MNKETLKPKQSKAISDKAQENFDSIIDALRTLTETVADLAKKINTMNEAHNKWVKAGKF